MTFFLPLPVIIIIILVDLWYTYKTEYIMLLFPGKNQTVPIKNTEKHKINIT
jgi:hypothetical protein